MTKEMVTVKFNLWKSTYTNTVYEQPVEQGVPKFGGWELVGTVEKEIELEKWIQYKKFL